MEKSLSEILPLDPIELCDCPGGLLENVTAKKGVSMSKFKLILDVVSVGDVIDGNIDSSGR